MSYVSWFLGPLGDLRELVCPEPGITDTVTRDGGVHQGLSGARTYDVTGHRSQYQFMFDYLSPEEFGWLRAMHTGMVPGPYRLLDPRFKNRLSTQSTAMTPVAASPEADIRKGLGFSVSTVVTREWAYDFPADVPYGSRSTRVSNYPVSSGVLHVGRFDYGYTTPVFDREEVTFSIYAKTDVAGATQPFYLIFDYFDRDLNQIGATPWELRTATDSWQRFSLTITAPADCVSVMPAMAFGEVNGTTSHPLLFAAPQLESGPIATDWEMGGGAKTVHIDALTTSSPRFPLTDCSLTLAEA